MTANTLPDEVLEAMVRALNMTSIMPAVRNRRLEDAFQALAAAGYAVVSVDDLQDASAVLERLSHYAPHAKMNRKKLAPFARDLSKRLIAAAQQEGENDG